MRACATSKALNHNTPEQLLTQSARKPHKLEPIGPLLPTMVRRRHRCAVAASLAACIRPAAALLAPPRLARTTARRVLADPPEEVETAIEALLQGAAVTTTDTAFEFVDPPAEQHKELETAEATVEALLQGSTSDETIQVYESFEEIAEQDELKAIESVEEMPLPELEREILVEDDDLLREVDQDDTLWSLVEDLPVVADPILAAVAPDVAVEADEDAITRRKVRMRALPLFVVWLAAPTLSLIDTAVVGRFAKGPAAAEASATAVSFSDSLAYLMTFLAI